MTKAGRIKKIGVCLSVVAALLLSAVPYAAAHATPKGGGPQSAGPFFSADRIRFQHQAAFGYSPALDDRIQRLGMLVYLGQELNSPLAPAGNPFPNIELQPSSPRPICNDIEDLNANPVDPADTTPTCFRDTFTMYPLQQWFFKEAVNGDAQLRLRVAWALSQIWVISGNEIKQSRHMIEYFKVLYEQALGQPNQQGEDYFELMRRMTLNPGMGDYLDMSVSSKERRNENYPRELLQLFTTGVYKLCTNGMYKAADGSCTTNAGLRQPLYGQPTIDNFTRVFTGWRFCNFSTAEHPCANVNAGTINFIDSMRVDPLEHDIDAKTLLPDSQFSTIGACPNCQVPGPPLVINPATTKIYADASLPQALRNIFHHPNVPPFVSRHLIQHLVKSNPSPDYIERVANVFINNGNNVRGDMKAVVRAILTDTEARGNSKEGEPGYGKLKEPVQYAANILRAFSSSGSPIDGKVFDVEKFRKMGQNPFYASSVFNYYSPTYTVKLNNENVLAPEFGLMTPTTSIARANFVNLLVITGLSGNPLDMADLVAINNNDPDNNNLVLTINQRYFHGTMASATETAIRTRLAGLDPGASSETRVREAVYLAMVSSQYQVQR